MEALEILAMDEAHLRDSFQVDGEFETRERLVVYTDETGITYQFAPCAPRTKCYPAEEIDIPTYIDHPERIIYIAYANGQVAGRIVLRKNWNGYGYIDDIAVGRAWRRRGIGRRLLDQAKAWCRERGLPGLMLETQDINAGACWMYAGCGFELGGFDRYLYKALDPGTDETALFWYWKPSQSG